VHIDVHDQSGAALSQQSVWPSASNTLAYDDQMSGVDAEIAAIVARNLGSAATTASIAGSKR